LFKFAKSGTPALILVYLVVVSSSAVSVRDPGVFEKVPRVDSARGVDFAGITAGEVYMSTPMG